MDDNIVLSKELIQTIAPECKAENPQIKFDDYGTLHVLERASDGALLHDYPVLKDDYKFEQPLTPKSKELDASMGKTKKLKRKFSLVSFSFTTMIVSALILYRFVYEMTLNMLAINLAVLIISTMIFVFGSAASIVRVM